MEHSQFLTLSTEAVLCSAAQGRRAFSYIGPVVWNRLPFLSAKLKLSIFKSQLKPRCSPSVCVRACVRARVRVCVRVCVCARVCFCVQSPCGGESVGVRWNCKGIFLPQYLSSTTPSKYIISLYANGEIACLSRSVTHPRLCRAECVTGKRLRSQTCHLTNLYLQRAPSWWWEVPLLSPLHSL